MKRYTFRIKRFDPEKENFRWDEFSVDMEPMERVLDGLDRIKDYADGSLTFRRSCGHGICGSCAMKINGRNRLACQSLLRDIEGRGTARRAPTVVIEPLEAFPVIKDLVVDMEDFFEKNDLVLPYLINDEPPPERERLQSPSEQEMILESITCIMCGSCTSSCPIYWTDSQYLGPSSLLKAYRFIFDSRDRAEEERLEKVTGVHGLWRCHSIFNCVESCPKEIDITGHITELKRLALKNRFRS
ncbi:MAG: succinate dehydrogenase iron-sulfur subunit [Nitrospirota bacterium]